MGKQKPINRHTKGQMKIELLTNFEGDVKM